MQSRKLFMAVLIVLLWYGLRTWACSQNASPETVQVLMQRDLDFAQTSHERGLEGWLSFFAEDARIFPPGQSILTGIEAIERFYKDSGFDPRGLRWHPEKAFVSSCGDFGYTFGYWETEDRDGEAEQGKYLSIWEKQADGTWKVVADIGSM